MRFMIVLYACTSESMTLRQTVTSAHFPFKQKIFFLIDHYTFNKRLKRSFCLLGKNIQKQVGLVVKKTQFLL